MKRKAIFSSELHLILYSSQLSKATVFPDNAVDYRQYPLPLSATNYINVTLHLVAKICLCNYQDVTLRFD